LAETTISNPLWYAIYTKPREEDRVSRNLTSWNIPTFAPKIKTKRYNQYSGAAIYIPQPLFPRYIFARFDAGSLLNKIYYTRGVKSIVGFNNVPLEVEDDIIALIQAQVGEDGFIRLGEDFKRGDEVTVRNGAFRGISGIFDRSMKDSGRVMILLNAINYQAAVIVEKEKVQKAGQPFHYA
jgi:transcriptional antiterminator RfaH